MQSDKFKNMKNFFSNEVLCAPCIIIERIDGTEYLNSFDWLVLILTINESKNTKKTDLEISLDRIWYLSKIIDMENYTEIDGIRFYAPTLIDEVDDIDFFGKRVNELIPIIRTTIPDDWIPGSYYKTIKTISAANTIEEIQQKLEWSRLETIDNLWDLLVAGLLRILPFN